METSEWKIKLGKFTAWKGSSTKIITIGMYSKNGFKTLLNYQWF
jgi:hypothetical protein